MSKKEEFDALFNNTAIGIVSMNRAGEIVLVNQFALKQFGYEHGELLGKKIEVLIPKRFMHSHVNHREQFYEHKAHSRPMGLGMDLYGQKKDGSEFPVEVSISHYQIDGQQFAVSFINDITIRKESEDALRRLNSELEEIVKARTLSLSETVYELEAQIREVEEKDAQLRMALEKEKDLNRLKSGFVSMASHEFRTPLSTILSSAYLVSKYHATEDQSKRERHIERIVSSVNMLTEILNDFLSLGKIDEGKIQVRFIEFNIKELIGVFANEMNSISKKGQKIIYNHTGVTHVSLDPNLLKHIAMNLVSNAIKFSPENSQILISTSIGKGVFTFSVKDSGLGISKEDQEHLFERFYRGSNVTNIQGTGLGLHIVSKYAELMNGDIKCNSDVNQGTEFIITFKIEN